VDILTLRRIPPAAGRFPVRVVVAKAVMKKAVERNLFRRRVKSLLIPASKAMKTGFLAIAKRGAAEAGFGEIKSEIASKMK